MWKFIKYSFNKAFEKNLLNLIIFFIVLSFIGVFVISTVIFILQKIGLLSENNFFTETLWQGFKLFFVTEAFFSLDNKNTFLDYFFKFNITIFGILIFSSIIGIITNSISTRIQELRTGKTKIEEEDHIVFFNFSRRLIPLLSELCNAYENEKQSFVIVSNEEPLVVMEKIKNVIKIPKNITILARKGYAWQKSLLDKINLKKAKQIIILKPDISELFKTEMDCDVEVGKSMSSIIASNQWDKNPCKILGEFHNEQRGFAHAWFSRSIWGKKVTELGNTWEIPEIISSQILKNNLLAQCTNTPDLTEIYDNLFGYEGSEIYFVDPAKPKFKDVLEKNIASIIMPIGIDHKDFLKKGTIDEIVYEKCSHLLNDSKIIVSKQKNLVLEKIKKNIKNNTSKKIFFGKNYSYQKNNKGFIYKDNLNIINLPFPNLIGEHQISNISTAIAAAKNIKKFKILDLHINKAITNIRSEGRLQIIKHGKLRNCVSKNNQIIIDGAHNPLAALKINNYLESLDSKKKYL